MTQEISTTNWRGALAELKGHRKLPMLSTTIAEFPMPTLYKGRRCANVGISNTNNTATSITGWLLWNTYLSYTLPLHF